MNVINIIIANVKFKFIYDFNLVNEGGSEYMRTKDTKLIFEPDVTTYDLENLFNGDERLGITIQNTFYKKKI